MTTTTEELVGLVAQLLSQTAGDGGPYPTDCGARVYAPRDWPTASQNYPAAFVSGPREHKRPLGSSGAPEYEVTSTIRIAARNSAGGSSADGNIGVLLTSLGNIRRQIETCIINNPSLSVLLERFGEVRAETAFKATGESHLGEMQIEIDLEYYQGPEDFFAVTGEQITEITLSTPYQTPLGPNVGFSVFPSTQD